MPASTPRVLAVIPPMTQLNTPYPSSAYLTGFLRSRGVTAFQEDLALALVLRLLSPEGLQAVAARVQALPEGMDWQLVRADGSTLLEAAYLMREADGTLIHITNKVLLIVLMCPGISRSGNGS